MEPIFKILDCNYKLDIEKRTFKEFAILDAGSNIIKDTVIMIPDVTNKVDKVTGKGLSTNDYTTAEQSKLAGIALGAEVNVQSDWNQSINTADDYIKNKPSIPSIVGLEETSNKVTSISAGSTDVQYPSAKLLFDQLATKQPTGSYLTSLAGAVLTDQTTAQTIGDTTNRLLKLWATDITVTNAITGSITGNAGTVTNGVYTTGSGTVFEVPLTFANGLTRTVNAVANNLITGLAGGQTVKGDTASGGNITIMSTDHATKGKILLGTSAYDEANNRLGIGTLTPTNELSFGNDAAKKIWIETSDVGLVGRALTIAAGSVASGTNIAGGSVVIQTGVGTGTGSETISFQTATTLTSGTTLQTNQTKLLIQGDGTILASTAGASRNIGTTSAARFQIQGTNNAPSGDMSITRNSSDILGATIFLGKSRANALSAVNAVVANDNIGVIAFAGANGVNIEYSCATIAVQATETHSATLGGSQMLFFTTINNTRTRTERLRITNDGLIGIAGATAPTFNLSFGGDAARTIGVETHSSGAGQNLTINAGRAKSGVNNLNGGELIFATGTTTGNGLAGITFQTVAPNQGSGSTDRSPVSKFRLTGDGGYAISLINKTGANTVKGTVVYTSSTTDMGFNINPLDGDMPIGIVLDDGVADGSYAWIVISGIAKVLLVDSVATTRGYVAYSSATTAGRIDTAAAAPAAPTHFREIGHTLDSALSGTNVLVRCVIHFN